MRSRDLLRVVDVAQINDGANHIRDAGTGFAQGLLDDRKGCTRLGVGIALFMPCGRAGSRNMNVAARADGARIAED